MMALPWKQAWRYSFCLYHFASEMDGGVDVCHDGPKDTGLLGLLAHMLSWMTRDTAAS